MNPSLSSSAPRPVGVAVLVLAFAGLSAVPLPAQCGWIPGQGFDLAASSQGGSEVRALVRLPNGNFVAAGLFDAIGGTSNANVAQWDGAGWLSLDTGMDGPVDALAVAPNGDVIAAGAFTLASGSPALGVARWNGAWWSAIGAGVAGGGNALAVAPNGDIFLGSGATIRRWNGTVWSTIGALAGLAAMVNDMAVTPAGDCVIVGRFLTVNGVTARQVARWVATTATFGALGTGTELMPSPGHQFPSAYAVAVRASGAVEIGGAFLASSSSFSLGTCRATWNGAWSYSQPTASIGDFGCQQVELLANGDLLLTRSSLSGMTVQVEQAGALTPLPGLFDGSIKALLGTPGGPYFAGGSFSAVGSTPTIGIARNACGYASTTPYGAGCYDNFATLYEHFTGGWWTLNQSTLRFTLAGDTYTVTHVPGAPTFTTPVSAPLIMTDDSLSAPISLPFTVPCPNLAPNQIVVGSNGIVYLQPSTDASAFYGNVGGLLSGSARWAPMWGDLDPGPTGSGTVHVDVDPVAQSVVVTWLDVQQWLNPVLLSTFQLYADSTGLVEYRYLDCFATVPVLAGWSPGHSARDRGSVDLVQAGPFACPPDSYALVHSAVGRPILGTTVSLETLFVPGTSTLAATVLGVTPIDPGIDLGGLGLPGCVQLTTIDAVIGTTPISSVVTYDLVVPNLASLVGAAVYSQGLSLAPGANAAEVITSNALALVVGSF